jgi:hypothetical protein
MMRPFPSDDYETPIEEYPGFLAVEWDESPLSTDTKELLDFWRETWSVYAETLVDEGLERDLVVHLPIGPIPIHVPADNKLALVLDQLPAFDVYLDRGPPDAAPASGSGYVIFLADKASMGEVKSTIAAVSEAIHTDYKELLAQVAHERGKPSVTS